MFKKSMLAALVIAVGLTGCTGVSVTAKIAESMTLALSSAPKKQTPIVAPTSTVRPSQKDQRSEL